MPSITTAVGIKHFLKQFLNSISGKYNVDMSTLMQQAKPESVYYGDLVNKYKRIPGKTFFLTNTK